MAEKWNTKWSNFVWGSNKRAERYGLKGRLALHPQRQPEPCSYCGDPTADTWDHVIPMGRGGANDLSNIVPCCLTCNRKKHLKPVSELGLYPMRFMCAWCWKPVYRSRKAVIAAAYRRRQGFACSPECKSRLGRHPWMRLLFGLSPFEKASTSAHAVYMRQWRNQKLDAGL